MSESEWRHQRGSEPIWGKRAHLRQRERGGKCGDRPEGARVLLVTKIYILGAIARRMASGAKEGQISGAIVWRPGLPVAKITLKAFDNPIRHAHNSTSSLLTQRRDERHSLPISVKSQRTNGVGGSFLKNQQPISVGVWGRWPALHCESDVVFGKEKYPDAHMKLIFPSQF